MSAHGVEVRREVAGAGEEVVGANHNPLGEDLGIRGVGCLAHLLHRRNQQSYQDANDGNHHQQLD